MPYSFTKIEKDKSRSIGLVFFVLILFYFLTSWVISLIIYNAGLFQVSGSSYSTASFQFAWIDWKGVLLIFGLSFCIGLCHWVYTVSNLCQKILNVLNAESLNPKDTYHQMFRNIIDEVSVATGGREIEGVVVPSTAMNAFAICDFSGRAIIGVTEGLLARLNRAQLEAVVGHEAAHILQGDCLQTTVTSSMFELYSGALKGIEHMLSGTRNVRYSGRGNGGTIVVIFLVYVLLSITKSMGQLIRMFISREREFRADATAVRLTRDPLSLAEALYSISYHWRGTGLAAGELEAIFILNPKFSSLDETSNSWSDLFSTHPAVDRRLSVLLDMAHIDVKTMSDEVKRKSQRPRTAAPQIKGEDTQWMVHREGNWEGPFELVQLITFDWLRPDMWINKVGTEQVVLAQDTPDIRAAVVKDKKGAGHNDCPKCHVPLSKIYYEGLEIDKCPFCRGVLVGENDVKRLILREEVGFSEKIARMGEQVRKAAKQWRDAKIKRDPKTLLICPKCQNDRARMNRMFYTAAYHVEIDKCFYCGLIWFDKDELEVLQYLIETRIGEKK